MDLPKRRKTDVISKIGVNAVSSLVNNKFHWIFREVHKEDDFGIDGYIDEVTESGGVTGRYCAAQIKTGNSYLNIENNSYWYKDEPAHLNYFINQPSPVLLILCDPETEICYWAHFKENLVETFEKSWKHPIVISSTLDLESKNDITKVIYEHELKNSGWERAPENLSLRTDGKYDYENVIVSFDAWTMSNEVTCVKLDFSEKLIASADPCVGAVNSVKAYLASIGARGQYMHALLEIRESKFHVKCSWCPTAYRQQFNDFFIPWIDDMDKFTEGAQMDGKLFDWIGCDAKGTGEWSMFLFDVTAFYKPEQFAHYEAK